MSIYLTLIPVKVHFDALQKRKRPESLTDIVQSFIGDLATENI